jgi:branched-chain amino acid transport system substrate-binding protein
VLTTSFYWDLDDATRAWTNRFRAFKDRPPTMNQVAAYASVRHWLRAVQQAGITEAKPVAATMRGLPVNYMYKDNVGIRADGRVLSKMYLMRVKAPAESAYRDDDYKILSVTPGAEAFRPLAGSECSLAHT